MSNDQAVPQQVPARTIPVPGHLSPQARRVLGQPLPDILYYPELDDLAGWRKFIAAKDKVVFDIVQARKARGQDSILPYRELREDETVAYDIRPDGLVSDDRRVFLHFHGGGLVTGGGETCLTMASDVASALGVRLVSVEYRMPPDHPFPLGVEDGVTFYRALLRDHAPSEIVVGGSSAGGNLAAATVLKARDEGLPLPAALILMTAELDLTESGDTFATHMGLDRALRVSLMPANLLYANGVSLTDPYVSPIFGDFTKGFPPTLLTAGTRDLFLSNAVRMHRALRKADITAELHVVEAASHGWFGGGAPEDAEIYDEIRKFCEAHWAKG